MATATIEVEVRHGPVLTIAMDVAKLAAEVAELLPASLGTKRDELRDRAASMVQRIAIELDRKYPEVPDPDRGTDAMLEAG